MAIKYRFNHIGLPTDKVQPNETYFPDLKLFCTDPDTTDYTIEYLRPEEGCTFFPFLLTQPHVSYQVDDLDEALKGCKVLVEPFYPMPKRRIAFVEVNGFIMEFAQDYE